MKAEYVDHMGTDLSVVNAARVSFDKVSEWEWAVEYPVDGGPGIELPHLAERDAKLINYLARGCSEKEWKAFLLDLNLAGHLGQTEDWGPDTRRVEEIVQGLMHMATHWTPFTHTAITLRMQAPVPIRTQCFKHKQGFTENEESRRYIKSTPVLFVPEHFRAAADNVKQGSGGVHPRSTVLLKAYEVHCARSIRFYERLIREGVCPEQARFVLPQGVEVKWIWTGNLASYARFYNQRTDSHVQKETQDLAKAVGEIIEPLFPVSWAALTS